MKHISGHCDLLDNQGQEADITVDKKVEFHFNSILDAIAERRKGKTEDMPLQGCFLSDFTLMTVWQTKVVYWGIFMFSDRIQEMHKLFLEETQIEFSEVCNSCNIEQDADSCAHLQCGVCVHDIVSTTLCVWNAVGVHDSLCVQDTGCLKHWVCHCPWCSVCPWYRVSVWPLCLSTTLCVCPDTVCVCVALCLQHCVSAMLCVHDTVSRTFYQSVTLCVTVTLSLSMTLCSFATLCPWHWVCLQHCVDTGCVCSTVYPQHCVCLRKLMFRTLGMLTLWVNVQPPAVFIGRKPTPTVSPW